MKYDEIMKKATAFYAAQVSPTGWVLYAKIPDSDKLEPVWPDSGGAAQPLSLDVDGYLYVDVDGYSKIPVWGAASSEALYDKLGTEYHLGAGKAEYRHRPIYILDGFDPSDGDEHDTSPRNPWAVIDAQLNQDKDSPAGIMETLCNLPDIEKLAVIRAMLKEIK